MEPLPPGLYFKLPAPFERLNRFPVERVQTITINGHDEAEHHEEEEEEVDEHDDGHGHNAKPKKQENDERIVLWSTSHDEKETPFIVAMKQEMPTAASKDSVGAPPLSIGLLAAHIPMYYKVKDLYKYYYKHNNPGKTLRNIATRELLSFMAQSDFSEVLGGKRHEAGKILQDRIQKIADGMDLGVDIVFVSLAGLHPPVSVGSAYDAVEAAQETKHQQILLAKAYAAGRAPVAQGERSTLINLAEAYKQARVRVSDAEAERFTRQLQGWRRSTVKNA